MIGRLRQGFWRLLTRSARAADARYRAVVAAAGNDEERLKGLSDADISAEAARLRGSRAANGSVFTDAQLSRWCAVGREAARRALGLRPFDVQLLAVVRLLSGDVVEMATGEGKTLSGALAAAGFAMRGRSVHVLSVNDYLAQRDAEWMDGLYRLLGVSAGWITAASTPRQRRRAYAMDVTYASVSEVGFDVLRDRLCTDPSELVAPRPDVALVDEADSVLVDEARVPLILAGGTREVAADQRLARIVATLQSGVDYRTDAEARNVFLTTAGERAVEKALGDIDLYAVEHSDTITQVNLALHAQVLLRRDVHYLVRDGEVRLIDNTRGRVAALQRWPDGLHAAVEAKEDLAATAGGEILDSLTIQGLVSRYPTVCGMTGTALAAGDQLRTYYGLRVAVVPPNTPGRRHDEPDRVYATVEAKESAVIAEIRAVHATGRPVLVGTLDVAESERLADRLADAGVSCVVLNARNDAQEAAIIARAGEAGAITISTQMAGRGTDIRLGGADVVALGGLYVIGTGHHRSVRMDDQLRGRAGRQGDPGGSVFFASLEDEQVQKYGAARHLSITPAADGRIHGKAVRHHIAHAQRVAEGADLTLHATTWRYNQLAESERAIVMEHRDRVLRTDHATDLLRRHRPARYTRLRKTVPAAVLDHAARLIVLHHLDRCWAEHLAFLAELRDGIHLRALGSYDPLTEFHRTAIPAFRQLLDEATSQAADTFQRAVITADGLDLETTGIQRPTATWTYAVHDAPFGTTFERIIRNTYAKLHRTTSTPHTEWTRISGTAIGQ